MKCRKCKTEVADDFKFCPRCGAQLHTEQATKSRGNGTGSVYRRGKTWVAAVTTGYYTGEEGKVRRSVRRKMGFKTKREALEYLPTLAKAPAKTRPRTFQQVYDLWQPTHQASRSTMLCYQAAMSHFRPVWGQPMADITVDDLQECMDECSKGKRTRQNMKTLAGLLYKFAIPRQLASLNMGEYVKVHADDTAAREGLPLDVLAAIEAHVGDVEGADYVLCQCYLGFRPAEFLALDAALYDRTERAFVGGAKTDAGRDRIVTVSPKIQPIVDRLVKDKIGGPVFCAKDGSPLPIKAYRAMFYKVLECCGVENPVEDGRRRYTPHSCRHTFATLMKRAPGADKDKLALIGHTSTEMLRHYQDVSLEDLRRITDAI